MKSIRHVLLIVLLVHAVAGGALVGWLGATGRLDQQRVRRVVDMFKLTIEQEQQLADQERKKQEAVQKLQDDLARLESIADGPVTQANRLERQRVADEVATQKIQFVNRMVENLTARIDEDKTQLDRSKTELEALKKQFAKQAEQFRAQQTDEDFLTAVRFYEQLKSKQTKAHFIELIAQGREADVIDYLTSMQSRKAAGVLREFKTDKEIEVAGSLIQQMRLRGAQLMDRDMAMTQGRES